MPQPHTLRHRTVPGPAQPLPDVGFTDQPANLVFAGPVSGSVSAEPAFRALVAADLPQVPGLGDLVAANNLSDLASVPTALTNLGVVKVNSTTTDPGVGSDNTLGYGVGSEWVNTTTQRIWTCYSAATGAAVWRKQTAVFATLSGAGSLGATTLFASAPAGMYRVTMSIVGKGTVNATAQVGFTDEDGNSDAWSVNGAFSGTGQMQSTSVLIRLATTGNIQVANTVNSGTPSNVNYDFALEAL